MSWVVQIAGTPEGVKKSLDEYADTLTGDSKTEFADVNPHLQGLVNQCVGNQIVMLTASGHASFKNGVKLHGQCGVTLSAFYGKIAT